jgi:long-chain acyl-CoA synthetase
MIAFDESVIMPWAAAHDLGGRSYADVVSSPRVHELIDGFVQRVNGDLQRWQTIKKFSVLPRDLDVEHGELTPSPKVKRPVVERTNAQAIEAMYEGSREA